MSHILFIVCRETRSFYTTFGNKKIFCRLHLNVCFGRAFPYPLPICNTVCSSLCLHNALGGGDGLETKFQVRTNKEEIIKKRLIHLLPSEDFVYTSFSVESSVTFLSVEGVKRHNHRPAHTYWAKGLSRTCTHTNKNCRWVNMMAAWALRES